MKPVALAPNVLRHFYAGGERIAALRATEPADHTPEMTCAAPWHAGMAYALGYIRAAMQAVERLAPVEMPVGV